MYGGDCVKKLGSVLINRNAKAGIVYLFGNLLTKFIAFITVPIFTRLMTTTEYGLVNTYMSWVSILSLLIGLSLGNSIRSAYIDYKNNLNEYISSMFFLSFINMLFVSILTFLVSTNIFKSIDSTLLVLCLIQSYSTFILATVEMKYMVMFEYKKKTAISVLPNIIAPILAIVLLFSISYQRVFLRIIPHVFVTLIIATVYFFSYVFKGRKLVNFEYWKYALRFSIPLVFHGLSATVLATSDRTMITALRSASETGVYSIVYNLSMIAMVATKSLESVWIPWFNDKMEKGEKELINKTAKQYIEIALIIMLSILMIGPELLKLLAPEEYWGGTSLIAPILFASFLIFLYSISVDLEYYFKSTKIIAINTVIAAIVNILLNFIFIPKYGMYAAAYTTVIAYLIMFIIHYFSARKLDSSLFPFKLYFPSLVVMVCAMLFLYLTKENYLFRWGITLLAFLIYLIIINKTGRLKSIINIKRR